MLATATLPLRPRDRGPALRLVTEDASGSGPDRPRDGAIPARDAGRPRRLVDAALLARAEARAIRAERRLRSRLVELTWPAATAGFAGGFAAVAAVRWAGF